MAFYRQAEQRFEAGREAITDNRKGLPVDDDVFANQPLASRPPAFVTATKRAQIRQQNTASPMLTGVIVLAFVQENKLFDAKPGSFEEKSGHLLRVGVNLLAIQLLNRQTQILHSQINECRRAKRQDTNTLGKTGRVRPLK